MLVLSRHLNEKIVFPGLGVAVQVVGMKPGLVRLGIEAPPEVRVLRAELDDYQAQWQAAAAAPHPAEERLLDVYRLVGKRVQIARTGLSVLRRQLAAGQTGEAEVTLQRLEEDLRLLQQRLGAGRGEVSPRPVPPKCAGRTALLVEDNPNERQLLATFLRGAGLEVATAGDGTDALDYLRQRGKPDVVLLDMGLPRCDGATMVRAVRGNPAFAGLKIFAVSGHAPEEFDLARGPAGVDRWFHKPIDPADLLHDVTEELDGTPCPR